MHDFNTSLWFGRSQRFDQDLYCLFIRSAHHSSEFLVHTTNAAYGSSEYKSTKVKIVINANICLYLFLFTHNFVGRKLGESSLFFKMSLHLLTVSKSRNVSPTLNSVAKHRAISLLVGGPCAPCMCRVSCSTNFCWHPLISL